MIEKIVDNEYLMEMFKTKYGILMCAHPFYDWFEVNIENINYKLIKAIITNIVPLGLEGRRYFEAIVSNSGFQNELLIIYNRLDKMFQENKLSIKTYFELICLGYTGEVFSNKSPVNDILNGT